MRITHVETPIEYDIFKEYQMKTVHNNSKYTEDFEESLEFSYDKNYKNIIVFDGDIVKHTIPFNKPKNKDSTIKHSNVFAYRNHHNVIITFDINIKCQEFDTKLLLFQTPNYVKPIESLLIRDSWKVISATFSICGSKIALLCDKVITQIPPHKKEDPEPSPLSPLLTWQFTHKQKVMIFDNQTKLFTDLIIIDYSETLTNIGRLITHNFQVAFNSILFNDQNNIVLNTLYHHMIITL